MTLKAKTIFISLLILVTVVFSFKLFVDYRTLHNSMVANLFASGDIVIAGSNIYRSLTGGEMDIDAAGRITEGIPETMKALTGKKLTREEFHNIVAVKLAFVRIERLLKGLPSDRTAAWSELKQIYNELSKIEGSISEFRKSFKQRMDRDMAYIVNIQAAIFATAGFGIIFILSGFYRSFLRPIFNLTLQIEAVKDGRLENISVYKGKDELGRLSDFTHKTLEEIQKSNKALSERYGMQYAISEILKASQKTWAIDVFLKKVVETILSIEWLSIQSKGGIFLIDEKNPDRLVLVAEKNFLEPHKKVCSEVPMGRCLCGRAAQSAASIYKASCDEEHETTYHGLEPHGHYCVPIKHEDKVLGVINLYIEDGHVLSRTEMEFIDAVSLIVAESLIMRKLSEREHLITTAIEESGESVIIADREGNIEYVNPAFERITGFSKEDVMRESLLTNIKCGLGEDVCSVVKSGSLWSGTFAGKRMDGKDYYEYLSINPVKDEKGDITKYVYIGRDITREKSLEEQLMQSQRMEVIGRFAGGIAHDFNNILTAIKGFGEFLIDEMKEGDPLRGYVEAIRSSTDRATNLTKSLLTFSRRQAVTLRPVDLNEVVKGVEKLLLRLIGEDIQFRTVLLERSLTVMADAGQMEQVLMNLVTNAGDAMPTGGTLTMETGVVDIDEEYVRHDIFSRPGPHAVLSVSDTGAGMDEKTRQKIFEPFFTTKEIGKGTGLGLSIVYGIIRQHDGNINVYSEQGLGTTFKIYLPLIKSGVEEIKPAETVSPVRGTETVLLAEDDPDVKKLIKDVLTKYGYTVMEAADGEEAVKVFMDNRDRIDILVFDMIMPKMKGDEAYKEILKIRPESKAIFMSGYTEEIIYGKGVLEKGLSFVSKPVSPHEILTRIREVLDL
jgi:PAS domain S-box-containing protein